MCASQIALLMQLASQHISGEQKELKNQKIPFGNVAQEAANGLEKSTQSRITGAQEVK
jgi:hypothetical protein